MKCRPRDSQTSKDVNLLQVATGVESLLANKSPVKLALVADCLWEHMEPQLKENCVKAIQAAINPTFATLVACSWIQSSREHVQGSGE